MFLQALDLVYGRVIAHELGHALDEAVLAAGQGPGARRAVFWTLGCVGRACTHPPHQVRASAYLEGYHAELAMILADQVRIFGSRGWATPMRCVG